MEKKLIFKGTKPRIRRPHTDVVERDYLDPESLAGDYIVDDSGYVPKHEQLRILQEHGAALDEYYRRLYPGFTHDSVDGNRPDTTHSEQINSRYKDFFDRVEFAQKYFDDLNSDIQKVRDYYEASNENKNQPTPPPSVDGGSEGELA